jgi:hypothetical protein
MLIKGYRLNDRQRRDVLNVFGYRWTVENMPRAKLWTGKPWPTVTPVTDEQWLRDHAFHFVKSGTRLKAGRHYAEPAYMAD